VAATELHTLASFRARFRHAPEDDDFVLEVLDEAAQRTPPDVWGVYTRAGHGYLAAHILGMEPYGRDARLRRNDSQTSYGLLREDLERSIGTAMAPRVTGST